MRAVGRVGAVCAFLSVVGFYASAYDVHGEEGMILGFQVVAPAIQLHLGMFWFFKVILGFFSLCFS